MPIKTRVTDMLGCEHPIIMGGMTGSGTPELAAAVSLAGGLGIFPIHGAGNTNDATTEANCREWIRRCRRLCKGKPFGVNLTILPAATPPPYELYVRVMIEEGVKIAETAGSNPRKYVPRFKEAGIITIHKCTSIRHALSAEKVGTDIISLDGFECAGHPGEDDVGNYVLQAKGARVLSTPYVCSGGVGTGMQLAAALAMGADGVNCGTAFCVTKECNWPESVKKMLVEGSELDSVLVFRKTNPPNTSRVFKNRVAAEAAKIEAGKLPGEFGIMDVMHLVAGKRRVEAEEAGDSPENAQEGIYSAGPVVGLITDIPSCKELVERMMEECESTIRGRLSALLTSSL